MRRSCTPSLLSCPFSALPERFLKRLFGDRQPETCPAGKNDYFPSSRSAAVLPATVQIFLNSALSYDRVVTKRLFLETIPVTLLGSEERKYGVRWKCRSARLFRFAGFIHPRCLDCSNRGVQFRDCSIDHHRRCAKRKERRGIPCATTRRGQRSAANPSAAFVALVIAAPPHGGGRAPRRSVGIGSDGERFADAAGHWRKGSGD